MPIHTTQRNLAGTLFALGEVDLAERIAVITPDEMDEIASAADDHAFEGSMFAIALAMAAVEVLRAKPARWHDPAVGWPRRPERTSSYSRRGRRTTGGR